MSEISRGPTCTSRSRQQPEMVRRMNTVSDSTALATRKRPRRLDRGIAAQTSRLHSINGRPVHRVFPPYFALTGRTEPAFTCPVTESAPPDMRTGGPTIQHFSGVPHEALCFTSMNSIRCSTRATTRVSAVANQILHFSRKVWLDCMNELRARTHDRHESGCFVLGTIDRHHRRARRCVYYDDLDPQAYSSGVCILHGDAFMRLWEICRAEKLTVIADIHTHPGAAFQSGSDRINPMIARAGHCAIIVPAYAAGWIWRHRLGVFQYEGDHRWTDLSGWQARSYLKVRWSWI